jgi:hypothetical protein
MKYEVDEIYSFKLNSGEELVAKVVNVDDNTITISDPVSIAPTQQGMGLVPSMFTSEQHGNVQLNTNSVALSGNTDESVKTKYIQATTGLTVPDKKVIMG